jgi:ubiquinone/menaquinone biosynthesis C-methylase UbiE
MTTAIVYDHESNVFAQHRQVHPEVLRCLASALFPEAKVLEVGCGTGNYLAALDKTIECSCWGIDPSAGMLVHAKARSQRLALSLGTAEKLRFPAA